jgi:hypothetical protein
MCTKLRYSTPAAAQHALDVLEQRIADGTIEDPCRAIRGYLCPDCDNWHLSKLGAKKFQATDVYATSVRGSVVSSVGPFEHQKGV